MIHVQSTIQTILAEIDSEGDVIKRVPYTLEIPNLTDEVFLEAAKRLRELKTAGRETPPAVTSPHKNHNVPDHR